MLGAHSDMRWVQQDLRTPAPTKAKELKSASKEKRSCEAAPKSGSASAKRQRAVAATPPKGLFSLAEAADSALQRSSLARALYPWLLCAAWLSFLSVVPVLQISHNGQWRYLVP